MKNTVFFISMMVILFSCATNRFVQSAQRQSDNRNDYVISIRSLNGAIIISELINASGGKLSVESLNRGEFNSGFLYQTEIQMIGRNMTNADLQNFFSAISKCTGIIEIHHYKI